MTSSGAASLTRRKMLELLAKGAAACAALGLPQARAGRPAKRLGVCIFSYGIQWRAKLAQPRFHNAVEFLRYCHRLGAGGIQIPISKAEAQALRKPAEELDMYLEGQVSLPKSKDDLDQFEAAVAAAKEAGAGVVRAAALSGRRYETFDSSSAFQKFAAQARQSVHWAEPLLRKHKVRLALENHKDWRVDELVPFLEQTSSEWVGVCVDTGNSIALLEQPLQFIQAYAPWAASSHLKDMGVRETEQGFLLSEVPLGEGFLDLAEIVRVLERAAPGIQFNLEMITRDPLVVPCFTDPYWATLEKTPARDLAATLATIRAHRADLPRVSHLSLEKRIEAEDQNVRKSFGFAQQRLNL